MSDSIILSENNKWFENHKENEFENDIFRQSLEIYQIQAESFYIFIQKQDYEIFAVIIKDIKKILKSKSYADSHFFVSEEYHDLIDVFER